MNPQLAKLFEEKELEDLKIAIAHDKVILPALLKILEYKGRQREVVPIDDPNWTIKRAMYDGQSKEIKWMINFLKEGQGGEGQKEEKEK